MAQGFGVGGRGLFIVRVVIITVCASLAVFLAVLLLLAAVNDEPSAEEVVQAFRDEGLEVGETQQIDRDQDRSLVPKTYEEQVSFLIPSSGEKTVGRVFTFESREDLEQVREHYEGFGDLFPAYVYVEGNVLVQIPGGVPENRAERYGEPLQEL